MLNVVNSCTTCNHDIPFIPLHYIYVLFTSSRCTSLHFFMISTTPSLRLVCYFPNTFPKIVWFAGERRWMWSSRWNENWKRKPKYSEKTCTSATLSTTNSTLTNPDSNPGCCVEKSATKGLNSGAASPFSYCIDEILKCMWFCPEEFQVSNFDHFWKRFK
jgi:hypothetical protein